MKLNCAALCIVATAWVGSASAFVPSSSLNHQKRSVVTAHYMFSGAGAGMPSEDNPEQEKMIEKAAAQMGMSVAEYKLGVSARMRLTEQLDSARVSQGSDAVKVERDVNNPPKYIEVTITDDGKALGKDKLSQELVSAFKKAANESKTVRQKYQKDMMEFISSQIKKQGM
jgi:hypothetical protein